jgi:hypothetical protein
MRDRAKMETRNLAVVPGLNKRLTVVSEKLNEH